MAIFLVNGRRILTTYVYPPIPIRTMDWTAIDDDTYDASYEGDHWKASPMGLGATEAEAVTDLLEQLEEEEGAMQANVTFADGQAELRATLDMLAAMMTRPDAVEYDCDACDPAAPEGMD